MSGQVNISLGLIARMSGKMMHNQRLRDLHLGHILVSARARYLVSARARDNLVPQGVSGSDTPTHPIHTQRRRPAGSWIPAVYRSRLRNVSVIDPRDLIDATQVAELLGLRHRNSVSTYMRRYQDFPRPVLDRGARRDRFWARRDVLDWVALHPGRQQGTE